MFQAASAYPLVAVVAPMGYGKTTLARQVAEQANGAVYFFSVSSESRNADGLWDSLWREAGEQGMAEASELRGMGFPKSPPQTRQALAILASIRPAVFIIDDYHYCNEPAVDVFLETAVLTAAGNFRFLLFSRTRPAMDIDALRDSGRAAVFERNLLAFSEREVKEYFFFNGVRDESVAENAWKYSEGWAAALWLCLRSSQSGGDAAPVEDVDSLLDKVVFAPCSPADRVFLTRLSLLDSFTASEAAMVAGEKNAGQRLDRIWSKIAFISRDTVHGRYRFHSIFKDFLRKKLEERPGSDLCALHRRTAECQAARREYMAAYRLLAKAGREQDMTRLLELLQEQMTEMTPDFSWDEIHALVQTIPWRLRLRRPYGFLSYLWLYLTLPEDGFDAALLDEFEKRVGAAALFPPEKQRLAGEIEYFRSALAFNDFHAAAVHLAKAHALLNGPSFLDHRRLSWNYGSPHFLFVYLWGGGRSRELAELMERIAGTMGAVLDGMCAGAHLAVRAEHHLERGELDEAEQPLTDAMELANLHENPTLLLMVCFSRARLLLARGRPQEALSYFLGATEKIRECGMFEHTGSCGAALGYVAACAGRPDLAPRWLWDGSLYGPPYDAPHPRSFALAVYGKLLLARGDYAGLAKLMDNSSDSFGPFDSVLGRIHKKILEAILARRRQGLERAADPLRSAIDLSRPDGFVLMFVEYCDAILPILRRLRRTDRDDPHLAKIYEWCNRAAHYSIENRSYKKSLLTPWERKVMRLLLKGKTASSIAQSLNIKESGVKTALQIAYAKLGARNRIEAARRFDAVYGGKEHAERRHGPPSGSKAERDESGSRAGSAAADALFESFRSLMQTGTDAGRMRALDLFLEAGAEEMAVSHMAEIRDAVQSLSWNVRTERVMGYLAFVRLFLWTGGDAGLAGQWITELEALLSEYAATPANPDRRVKGETALIKGILSFNDMDAFWKGCGEALALLRGPSRIHPQLLGLDYGSPHLSFVCFRGEGAFEELVQSAAASEDVLAALSDGSAKGCASVMRLERHLERGEFETARACLDAFGEENGGAGLTAEIHARFAHARLLLAEGGADEAVETLMALRRRAGETGAFRSLESVELALGYIYSGMGRADLVPEWIREGGGFLFRPDVVRKNPFHLVAHGRALMAAGDFDRLGTVARNMPLRFGVCGSLLGLIHAKTLEAVHLLHCRGKKPALEALRAAVGLSRPHGILLPLAEYGSMITPLLRELAKTHGEETYANRVLALAGPIRRNRVKAGGGAGSGRKDVLTLREQEIMRLLTRGLSNAAIGKELGIATDSVKKALTAIYAKLGASNRLKASRLFDARYKRGSS